MCCGDWTWEARSVRLPSPDGNRNSRRALCYAMVAGGRRKRLVNRKKSRSARKLEALSRRELAARLQEAEEILQAIRSGEVDAIVVNGPGGEKVFTLQGA